MHAYKNHLDIIEYLLEPYTNLIFDDLAFFDDLMNLTFYDVT